MMNVDKYAMVFARNHIRAAKGFAPGTPEKKYHINKSMELTKKIFCEAETLYVHGKKVNVIINTVTGNYID